MKKIFLILLIILVSFFTIGYKNFKSQIIIKKDQFIEIKKGETYNTLGNKYNLNKNYYKLYLKLNPPLHLLQAGTYKLNGNLNIDGLVNSLKTPITTDKVITILEGWNIYDIDDYLAKNSLIKPGELIKINKLKLPEYKNKFSFLKNVTTLEGFLYPDTYFVNPNNFKINEFTENMLTNFNEKVIKDLNIDLSNINILETVNIAAIVEKEERKVSEKPIVAGILKKRLLERWLIGADATVCYPYKLIFSECTPAFIVNHIDDRNEYNTRTKIGLPATPISNPSVDTIEAVINSKNTPYYFYLHDENGKIHYATTNEEHIANKQLYIK